MFIASQPLIVLAWAASRASWSFVLGLLTLAIVSDTCANTSRIQFLLLSLSAGTDFERVSDSTAVRSRAVRKINGSKIRHHASNPVDRIYRHIYCCRLTDEWSSSFGKSLRIDAVRSQLCTWYELR